MIDPERLARAIHEYMHLDTEVECDAPGDAREIAALYRSLPAPTEQITQAVRDIKRMEKINPPYPGLVMNDPDAGL